MQHINIKILVQAAHSHDVDKHFNKLAPLDKLDPFKSGSVNLNKPYSATVEYFTRYKH